MPEDALSDALILAVIERSGVHVTEVSRIERGLREPKLTTIVRLAHALEVKPARLLDGL